MPMLAPLVRLAAELMYLKYRSWWLGLFLTVFGTSCIFRCESIWVSGVRACLAWLTGEVGNFIAFGFAPGSALCD